ncbi:hypothetical protein PPBDW_II1271 [Photobacterium kishitanii]|nr:hypothetical protein PPBDW_II1271 [Photobacterium kishitanii]
MRNLSKGRYGIKLTFIKETKKMALIAENLKQFRYKKFKNTTCLRCFAFLTIMYQ